MLSFDETAAVRRCGASYAYCNGNCSECEANRTYATNSTEAKSMYMNDTLPEYDMDAFGKPSKEAYEKAKKDKEYVANALFLCRKRRDDLIDELSREREHEKFYLEQYEKHRNIIRKYEIYEELQSDD